MLNINVSFIVAGKYNIQIISSPLGLEKYFVDGKEVLRLRSFAIRGSRSLTVGKGKDKHEVEIKYDMAPTIKSWVFPVDWIAEVYVDGVLTIEDLAPGIRTKAKLLLIIPLAIILIDLIYSSISFFKN